MLAQTIGGSWPTTRVRSCPHPFGLDDVGQGFRSPSRSQRASMTSGQPSARVFRIFRSSPKEAARSGSPSSGSVILRPHTRAMLRHRRTSWARSSWSARPKLWMILATGLRVLGSRWLWASWKLIGAVFVVPLCGSQVHSHLGVIVSIQWLNGLNVCLQFWAQLTSRIFITY